MSDIKKAFISFRVGYPQWHREKRFSELLKTFSQYPEVTDEITLLTAETHSPLLLQEHLRRCHILADRISSVKETGLRCGINILASIGHHEENLDNSLLCDYQNLLDIDGKICRGSFCPNDQRFLEDYIKPVYESIADANPDYIWIDDDVRLLGHIPITATCFCDNCIQIFNRRNSSSYTRKSLKDAFNSGPEEERFVIRKLWVLHNGNTIRNFLEFIENVVHAKFPGMPLGFMDGIRFYEGFDMESWAKALAGENDIDVYWRPGCGTYTEERPDEILEKAHAIGIEADFLPDEVKNIQSELENFPYQRLRKSVHYTALEAAVYQGSGSTGTAFNVLSMYDEPLDDYLPLIEKLNKCRPFYDLIASTNGRAAPTGVYSGWNRFCFAGKGLDCNDWPEPSGEIALTSHANELYSTGLPVSYCFDNAFVTALTGRSVIGMSDQDIIKMLSRGVYMDGDAVERLNARGFGEYIGFSVSNTIDKDAVEILTGHELNSMYAGRTRNGRQAFWYKKAFVFESIERNTEVLSTLSDYTYADSGYCTRGIFENKLGGRVCVSGYYPWTQLHYRFMTQPMKKLFAWLSNESLGAYVESYHRVALWDRIIAGRHSIFLLNMYMDSAEDFRLAIKSSADRLKIYDMHCNCSHVDKTGNDGCYGIFTLPELRPWHPFFVVE
ncbi:MAG: hypothetical protein JXR78_03400 [Victivallales bacterium]|nr:hypothetical protein [Victivallales bacterium]